MFIGWMRPVGKLMFVGGVAVCVASFFTDTESGGQMGLLITGGTIAFIGLCWWAVMGLVAPKLEDDAEIEKYGRPAKATVLSAKQVGVEGTGEPRIKLEIEAKPSGQSAYKTDKEVMVSEIPQPGDVISIKFDPNRKKNFVLA